MSDNGFSPAAADSLGHSPKLGFSLHKALDRVLRKVGAREKSQTLPPPRGQHWNRPLEWAHLQAEQHRQHGLA